MNRLLLIQILFPETVHNLIGGYLALFLGNLLNHICKFLMHTLRQLEAKIRIHDKGHTALSGL